MGANPDTDKFPLGTVPDERAGTISKVPARYCLCGCGQELLNHRSNARYLDETHRNRVRNRTRTRTRKPRVLTRPFVAIDGEGENLPDGSHIYTLLATREKDIASKQGLGTEECLDFLLSLPRGQGGGWKPIYVWFSFDYDVNMILGDLPLKGENSIEVLRKNNRVQWKGYTITYIHRKILRISRGKQRHTSYDVWGFFQSSFEQSLTNWKIQSKPIIAEGKASRDGFSSWNLERIREYNYAELECLEQLAEKLRDSINPLQLPIQSWHGPAALAAAWLRKNKCKEWLQNEIPDSHFSDVCSRGYFGGRIDVLGYGMVNPVYHYDIVSAYPSATRICPDLSKLRWVRQGKGYPRGRLYVSRIRWRIPATYWAPLPWRSTNGSIRYPLEGEGWYWYPEIETAIKKYGKEYFEFLETYYADGEIVYPFRNLIEETFRYRQELKAQNHPSHVPVKLILNSLYGKFAQTVGKASYYSSIWAGLITSETRAKLMAVLSDDVVCVMTDSIWSSKPLDIPLGSELGDWEQQNEYELVLVEAGLYEATNSKDTRVWQRGFDKRNPVDIRGLVGKWLREDPSYEAVYTVNRFIGMGLASVTSYPWRYWINIDRTIKPVPLAGTTKRLPIYPLAKGGTISDTFVQLKPRPRDTLELSAPYSKVTFDAEVIRERLEEECSDD